jgi:WD40 repeat protein
MIVYWILLSLSSDSKYLVSGSTDQSISLFNFSKIAEDGQLNIKKLSNQPSKNQIQQPQLLNQNTNPSILLETQ